MCVCLCVIDRGDARGKPRRLHPRSRDQWDGGEPVQQTQVRTKRHRCGSRRVFCFSVTSLYWKVNKKWDHIARWCWIHFLRRAKTHPGGGGLCLLQAVCQLRARFEASAPVGWWFIALSTCCCVCEEHISDTGGVTVNIQVMVQLVM